MIRVRFAPSPTGYLHVGGARTALFNWLFARHDGGTFVLRIEDTDQERSTEDSIAQIIEAMRWLGLDWDEYYRQTERRGAHQKAAEQLLATGCVYEQDGAWWFRVPEGGTTSFHDDLLGEVGFQNELLKDFVIRRADETFVYNFAVVVDDVDMEITHVIRGDDHVNNTPKQVLLYEALGRPLPRFAHLPMILGPDRTRLSKRHGDTSVLDYRRRGLLPEAMVNFLARLGWSYGDQEVFDSDELVRLFALDRVGSSAAVFDEAKLSWLNHEHLRRTPPQEVVHRVEPFVLERGVPKAAWAEAGEERLARGVVLLRDRASTLVELALAMEIFFLDASFAPVSPTPEQASLLRVVADALDSSADFTPAGVEAAMRGAVEKRGAKLKDVGQVSRLAATGRAVGPGLFDVLSVLGKDLVVRRLRAAAGGHG